MAEPRVRYFDALSRAAEAVNSSLTLNEAHQVCLQELWQLQP